MTEAIQDAKLDMGFGVVRVELDCRMAFIDGCVEITDVVKPLGECKPGLLTVRRYKDRAAQVTQHNHIIHVLV